MLPLSRLAFAENLPKALRLTSQSRTVSRLAKDDEDDTTEFRTLDLNPQKKDRKRFDERKNAQYHDLLPPRETRMHVDQDWTNVWPAAASFKASAVPLPVRMGKTNLSKKDTKPPVQKFGNAELMKVPNFLHLTPAHIQKQCAALKKFCTPWPEELVAEEDCERHFPVQIITSDYCHSGFSIRDTRARIVSMKIPLSSLDFDDHARDKFLRLVGDRYDPKKDVITLITDRCPTRKQNYDYACYLITALYFESKKIEPWEEEKSVVDREKYVWEGSASETTATQIVQKMTAVGDEGMSSDKKDTVPSTEEVKKLKIVQQYERAVSELLNGGEDFRTIENYKTSVKHLLGFS